MRSLLDLHDRESIFTQRCQVWLQNTKGISWIMLSAEQATSSHTWLNLNRYLEVHIAEDKWRLKLEHFYYQFSVFMWNCLTGPEELVWQNLRLQKFLHFCILWLLHKTTFNCGFSIFLLSDTFVRYIKPVLFCGCKARMGRYKKRKKRLESAEMWFLRIYHEQWEKLNQVWKKHKKQGKL